MTADAGFLLELEMIAGFDFVRRLSISTRRTQAFKALDGFLVAGLVLQEDLIVWSCFLS